MSATFSKCCLPDHTDYLTEMEYNDTAGADYQIGVVQQLSHFHELFAMHPLG